jgi:hypothetical protein
MSYLNANIPPIYCKVKKEYLYDLKEHQGESEECVVFGITSISGCAILFNIMLPNGACFWRLPISAFFQKSHDRATVPNMQTHELELWNCFSYYPSVTCFDWLAGLKGKFLGLDKKFYHGKYLFTIDWAHPETNILDTIVFCGTLIVLLLTQVGLTIKCKLLTGMQKIVVWLQKIVTKCFIKWKKRND